ncbi:unnamed protein product [Clonostachys byssicola]|uniref:Uncharacterized protein n=1 Tax=Clonostachys byssicola TaxID=160290 RepID=A0A9N9URX0_9HYPO|nr:unnamed protein product [Clonostachys byssicola]
MWAPKIHRIGGVWYMFYSSRAMNDKNSSRTRALRGCDGPSPFDCDYSFQGDLVPPRWERGGKDGNGACGGKYGLGINEAPFGVGKSVEEFLKAWDPAV